MHLNENSPSSKRELLAKTLRAVGDASRMQILCVMFKHPGVCVSELAERTGTSVAIVSHHVRTLARTGVLVPRKVGKKVCYGLADSILVRDIRKLICNNTKT